MWDWVTKILSSVGTLLTTLLSATKIADWVRDRSSKSNQKNGQPSNVSRGGASFSRDDHDTLKTAQAAASTASPRNTSDHNHRDVVSRAIQSGDFDIALQSALKITSNTTRDYALHDIALAAYRAGESDLSMQAARQIHSNTLRRRCTDAMTTGTVG